MLKDSIKIFPLKKKKSFRWIKHLSAINFLLNDSGNELIHVADRECDIYEFMQEAETSQSKYVVRSGPDRRSQKNESKTDTSTIQKKLDEAKVKGSLQVLKDGTIVDCDIKQISSIFKPPQRLAASNSQKLEAITVTVLKVKSSKKNHNLYIGGF